MCVLSGERTRSATNWLMCGGSRAREQWWVRCRWLNATRKDRPMPRELIEPHKGDKRYVRRGAKGRLKKQVAVGRSLAADRRSKSKTVAKRGEGDRGDRRPRAR